MCEIHVPCCISPWVWWKVCRHSRAVCVRRTIIDDVYLACAASAAPWEDGSFSRVRVNLEWSGPRLTEGPRETVEEVVIVTVDHVQVSALVNTYVDEGVPVV